jgi:cell division protein FtsN
MDTAARSGANVGIIVGSAVGVAAALVCVLLAGFILGKRLQSNNKAVASPEKQSNGTTPMISQGSPETFLEPTDRFIEVNDDDEISMLEDPTIFTKDNTVTRMMREADEQETLGGVETTNGQSMQAEEDTVDRTLWSRTSC